MALGDYGNTSLKNNRKMREPRSGMSKARLNTRKYKDKSEKANTNSDSDYSVYREWRNKKRNQESRQRKISFIIMIVIALILTLLFVRFYTLIH